MNPRAFLMILLAAAAAIALLVWLTAWWISRSAGVRRSDFKQMRQERDLAWKALRDIEVKADYYRDLDSVLAADVRIILRSYNDDRMELNR